MKIPNSTRAGDHWYDEGDCGRPIRNYYKKRFWKRHDRKKYLRGFINGIE